MITDYTIAHAGTDMFHPLVTVLHVKISMNAKRMHMDAQSTVTVLIMMALLYVNV